MESSPVLLLYHVLDNISCVSCEQWKTDDKQWKINTKWWGKANFRLWFWWAKTWTRQANLTWTTVLFQK